MKPKQINNTGTANMTTSDLPAAYQALHGKKILVTGAAGFIGGATFRRLASYGLDVVGTALYPSEVEQLQTEGYQAVQLDLTSDDCWDDLLADVDIVFHIAAVFQEVELDEQAYDKANHTGALKLLKTAQRNGVERFVHCSTVGVHGNVKEIPATEQTPFNPMDIYHRTKLKGELAILDYARALPEDGMCVTVNRPSMVYGPGDMRMFKLFKTILKQRFRMIGSGKTLAHLCYIEDQVDSLLLGAVQPREQVHLQAFNIASAHPITLNKLAEMIAHAGQVKLSSWHIPVAPVWLAALLCEILYKPFGIKPPLFRRRVGFFTYNRAFDISKAQQGLNYHPSWDEERGVAATIDWYRQQNLV